MAAVSPHILSLKDLAVGYESHQKPLLQGLNTALQPGSLTALLGANGIGKSTLLRTMAGIQTPLSGTVYLDGSNVATLSQEKVARAISIVLTERPSTGAMNVEELVSLGRFPFTNWLGTLLQSDKKAILAALEAVDLFSLRYQAVNTLSDGQFQKAMIARAIAQESHVMLLDEPTAHLDIPNKVAVMQLLRKLAKTLNMALLVSTHDLDLAIQTSDYLWLAHADGQLETGLTEELALNRAFDLVFQLSENGLRLEKGHLMVNHQTSGEYVTLSGDDDIAFWTALYLQKQGIKTQVVRDGHIHAIKQDDHQSKWSYKGIMFSTLESLYKTLRE